METYHCLMLEIEGKNKMPQGKGTYGSKVGRPSKKKYDDGGSVDPFSLRNPEGVPMEQAMEALEDINMAREGLPTSDAQERSQVSPDVTSYKEGGKVESTYNAYKTWKDVRKAAKKAGHSDTYGKPTAKKIALHTTDILEHGHRGNVGDIVKTIEKSKKGKKK